MSRGSQGLRSVAKEKPDYRTSGSHLAGLSGLRRGALAEDNWQPTPQARAVQRAKSLFMDRYNSQSRHNKIAGLADRSVWLAARVLESDSALGKNELGEHFRRGLRLLYVAICMIVATRQA